MGAPGDCPVPAGARTLDVGDGTVLPGLVDLHVHARPGYVDWSPREGAGGSLHRELEILVELGMTPLEAIHAATGRAALVLGSEEIGVIAPGRLADLLVVEGDPTVDISATRRIRQVILDGETLEGEPREDRPRDGEQGGDL